MSRRGLKLKADQTLVEASFKLEDISEDIDNVVNRSLASSFGLAHADNVKTAIREIAPE